MFIFNFKINGNKIFKIFFSFSCLLLIFLLVFVTFKIFKGAKPDVTACTPQSETFKISSKNYTNVLKTVHDNIDSYVGKKIKFTGYIYRTLDFKDNQFVLARNMIISSDLKTVVVGFLCEYDDIKNFKDGTWIDVTGQISKGSYHGDMPIIKITEIKECDKPKDEFVYPPDENYVPTSSWL